MSRNILLTIAIGLAILSSVSARADVIFDNGGPNLGGAFISDASESWEQADDFSLVPGSNILADVHWWGIYVFGNSPETDTFTIRIFGNNEGALNDYPTANPLYEFSGIAGGRTATGDVISVALPGGGAQDYDVYAYSADIAPLALAPNTTYWISIQNDTSNDGDDSWLWATSANSGGNEHHRQNGGSWDTDKLEDLAFYLTGPVVPEPASMTLLGLGIAGLAFRMRRKNG